MPTLFLWTIFTLASYCCITLYNMRAYAYCQGIFKPGRNRRLGKGASLVVTYQALSLALFGGLPALISLIMIYFMVMLQFLYFFHGRLIALIFGSGTFMFHIMNVKMAVTSIFMLIYGVPSYALFRQSGFFFGCTFATVLLLLVSLEVFQRTIDLQMIQTLMKTPSQLRFVTSSMMLINVYLLILSVSYSEQIYSSLVGIFLLSTALLLFGAFYTSFLHAVKMSVMMENEIKSQRLEEQLRATKEDVQELQVFAFTDTLTAVHNRRFGLDELNKLIQKQLPFCLCFLDIDHLKYVNDTFGHAQGDRYILDVVKVLSGAPVKGELLCRMGGDEFMLVMPGVSRSAALERLREVAREVSRIPWSYHPSVSYGIVEVKAGAGLNAAQILRQADQEMYKYKQKNQSGLSGRTAPD